MSLMTNLKHIAHSPILLSTKHIFYDIQAPNRNDHHRENTTFYRCSNTQYQSTITEWLLCHSAHHYSRKFAYLHTKVDSLVSMYQCYIPGAMVTHSTGMTAATSTLACKKALQRHSQLSK